MTLTIVPGWGEGKRQMNAAVGEFDERGIETQYSRTLSARRTYEDIVAHSGGCYQYWSKIQADRIFLIAPPWHSLGRFTNLELARRARARHKDKASHQSVVQTLRFLASVRSTLRHRRAVREIDLLGELTDWLNQDKNRQVELVFYKGDIWTDMEIKQAFGILPRTRTTVLQGNHDDLRHRPADIVKLVSDVIKNRSERT